MRKTQSIQHCHLWTTKSITFELNFLLIYVSVWSKCILLYLLNLFKCCFPVTEHVNSELSLKPGIACVNFHRNSF